MDRYIKEYIFPITPLHEKQHAFRTGHSVETALHNVTLAIEKALKVKYYTIGCFLDIEGAFNMTSVEVLVTAMEEFNLHQKQKMWITNMLTKRRLVATRGGHSVSEYVNRGCPQGGILSPLLWCLAVNSLLHALEECGVTISAYADDVVFLATSSDIHEAYDKAQEALEILKIWCDSTGLSVNPDKLEVVRFTKRIKIPATEPLRYEGKDLKLVDEVKFLGVTFTKKLLWRRHVFNKVACGKNNLYMVSRAIGGTWGFSPRITNWIYKSIVVPRVTHGAIAWWQAAKMTTVKNKLNSLQGLALRRALGSLSTTPLRAMEVLTNTTPLDTVILDIAIRTAHRLKCWDSWTGNSYGHASIIQNEADMDMNNWMSMDQDRCAPSMVPKQLFQAEAVAIIKCTQLLMDKGIKQKTIRIFTDSQAVLLSVQKLMHTSMTTRRCKECLNELVSRGNKVMLCWVPGHKGIPGNELADKLTNLGSRRAPPEGVPRQVPLAEAVFALSRKKWREDQRKRKWDSAEGCRVAKMMIGQNPVYKNWRDLMGLPREDTRRVAGLLTGHAILNHHLTRIGELQEEGCDFCNEDTAESAEHILMRCPGLMETRFKRFRKAILEEEDVSQLAIRGIQEFVQDIDRKWPRDEEEEEEEEVW
ncbi:PREDICTED: RNA-directed DNA polymerase from mobile element jockey-like [Dufourea novaeangliae]|uniref:RNA-directed DNA polymerase from mobile element jockey-like n=1 Tax=Dufourea novaeangliae TaxID=178035 RepID=UPI0007675ECE|nr:PREDICTED: RNA-directed DNA polymerase from mobile element jockey-like [Dufourea novaeangliae]